MLKYALPHKLGYQSNAVLEKIASSKKLPNCQIKRRLVERIKAPGNFSFDIIPKAQTYNQT